MSQSCDKDLGGETHVDPEICFFKPNRGVIFLYLYKVRYSSLIHKMSSIKVNILLRKMRLFPMTWLTPIVLYLLVQTVPIQLDKLNIHH